MGRNLRIQQTLGDRSMSKKKKLAAAVFILAVIALNVFIVLHRGAGNRSLTLRMTVESAQNAVVQVYYTADTDFSEAMSDKKEYTGLSLIHI